MWVLEVHKEIIYMNHVEGEKSKYQSGCSDNKLRILYVITRFPSISETFIVNQIVDMINRGHEIVIYAFKQENADILHDKISKYDLLNKTIFAPKLPDSLIKRAGIAASLIRFSKYNLKVWFNVSSLRRFGFSSILPFRRFIYSLDLAKCMTEFKPDIIHAHFSYNAILPMCLQKAGVCSLAKMVVTFHGCDLHSVRHNIYTDLFRHAQQFTVNSDYSYGVARKIGCPEKKLTKLPMGVDCDKFAPKEKSEQTSKEYISITFVGRLVEIKGIDVAIRAISELCKMCEMNIRFNIIGDGSMRNDAESLAKALNISENVIFKGALSQEDVIKLFSISDIFLFSGVIAKDGRQETQGLVVQEAQSMELPVVVTDVGGVPEGVVDKETGFVVPERDVNAISKALCYLVAHEKTRISMGKNGRKFIKNKFDVVMLGDKLENVYHKLI